MANEIRKIQNKIYKTVADFCGRLHKDDAWQHVGMLSDMIKSVDGVTDVILGAGVYHNYINKTDPYSGAYRDYETIVTTPFGNLYGYIRCHAAGNVDDEFDRYDMTISLYPDRKRDMTEKRVILTAKQLNEIMDNQKSVVNFTGGNANEMGTNAQEKYNDALHSGFKSNAITLQGKSIRNNATDKDETVIGFDSTKGNIKDAVTNAVQNAVNNGADINKLSVKDNPEDITNGVTENKTYTKLNVERARLYEMRRNGVVLTKKQLTEEILGDGIEAILGKTNAFIALQAFGDVFGDEELQKLSSSLDMSRTIIDIYNQATPEQQEQFKSLLLKK